MEMDAVVQEKASLEAQLAALKTQINSLTSELEEQRAKVKELLAHTSCREIIVT